jgi:hypothetical protein
MENRFRHKDGSWCWIAWTLTADNGLMYLAGRHVTSEKESAAALERAHQQLANAQKMEALGQLTGGVAHDFNKTRTAASATPADKAEGLCFVGCQPRSGAASQGDDPAAADPRLASPHTNRLGDRKDACSAPAPLTT